MHAQRLPVTGSGAGLRCHRCCLGPQSPHVLLASKVYVRHVVVPRLSYRVSRSALALVQPLPFLHLCLLLPSGLPSPVLPQQFGSSAASPPLSADPPAPWASVVAPLPVMAANALALVVVALAKANPGGVPGRQVPALI
ncbi:unnamed protein product [Closterium sp. NIES-64]|nr:unnamed protein product [Closterium sp. NIES-64]